MLNFITSMFGKKSDKDIKQILPIIEKIRTAEKKIDKLTNDELRAKTIEFKDIISRKTQKEQNKIDTIKSKVDNDPEMDIMKKEELWNQIDKIEETITGIIEDVLNEILPEAFAVMRVTARGLKKMKFSKSLPPSMIRIWPPNTTA